MAMDLLKEASAAGVALFLSNGKLKVRAGKGALSDGLRQRILDAKEEIVALLSELEGLRMEDGSDAIKPALRRDGRLPLSLQQQRLWVLEELYPGSVDYSMPFAFRIRGEFSVEHAQAALAQVAARHEALRTSFHRDDEDIYQRCEDNLAPRIARHDLSRVPAHERDDAVRRFIAEDAAAPFDLGRAPLLRAAWLQLAADEGVLYFNLHHIVFDGWSMDVLLREFVAFYRERTLGEPSALLPPSIQYADYAVWQRQRLSQDRLDEHLGYWTQALSAAPIVHSLPLDFERPKVKSQRGELFRSRVPAARLGELQAFAERHDITLFMLLHGALSLVLARYGSEPDVVVGTPVANRGSSQLDELIGFFINTLVLRVSCEESQSVREFFAQVREVDLGAQSRQDIPFEMLIERLDIPRSTAHTPLFQVMLSLDNNARTASSGGAFEVEAVDVGIGQAKYDLTLNAGVGPQGLELSWVYDTSLFHAETVRRLDGHLDVLLQALTGDPQRRLSELDSLGPEERAFVADDLVGETVAIDPELLPDRQVAATARLRPDAVAVRAGGAALSYAELDRQIDHVANLLAARGIARQDRVGIVLPPSPAMAAAVLACLRAGAVYVPIDPAAAQKKIDHIVADSQIKLLLTVSTLPDFTRASGVQACYLDEALERADWRAAAPASVADCGADDLAYILYTSGSTGQPKGVAIARGGLSNYLGHCLRAYAGERFEEAVMSSPLSFDATITTFFTPLICGATLRILDARQEALARELGELMLGDAVPRLFKLTPAHLDLLLRYWREQDETRRGQAPMQVVIGGEQLLKKTLEPFLDRLAAGSTFVNEYGPTETVVGCCTYTVRARADLAGDGAMVPIGRPIQNTRLQLLREGGLSPLGATGELFIAGAGVARGYLNQPELQQRHFVEHDAGGRATPFYRSGDLARYGDNGQLIFVGRNDEQIKLRGYRIEPAEIEACLCAFAGVAEACVLLSDRLATPALVAYVVAPGAAGREDALAEQLRDWCKAGLAAPQVPAAFKFVAQLPTTANGKVDKRALAALPLNLQPTTSYAAPETPMQQALAELFAGLLKHERVGIHDNFFDLGGDSILAIQTVSRAKKAGLQITTRQIFEHQTVAGLSKVAVKLGSQTVGVETGAGPFALTPIQQWFVHAQPQTLNHYNQKLFLEAPAQLDGAALARIVEALLRRHDGLRSTFAERDGAWAAHERPYDAALLERSVAVETLPDGVEESRRFIAARCNHYQASLNLEHGPLFKAVLFAGERGSRLLILAHHMVVDGVSWRVLLEDFERAWRQLAAGEPIALGAKGTSYQYWSGLLARTAAGDAVGQERDYWREQLAADNFGFREFEPAQPPAVASGKQVVLELSADDTAALLTHANTPYATRTLELLLAAVYLGLAPWAGRDAFAVELEGHGRETLEAHLDLSETLGWFTCMYPHVLRGVAGDVGATLRAIKEDARAIPGGGIGFGLLKYLAREPSLQDEQRAPHIVFNYLGQLDQGGPAQSAFALANEDAGAEIAPNARRGHRLVITAFALGGRMRLNLDYSQDEYSQATAAAMAQSIVAAAQALVEHCGKQHARVFTPSDFPLAAIGREALDRLQAAEEIGDLYPSTPMQRSMLAANELHRSAYVAQFYPMLRGALDPALFAQAWQGVVDQYVVLRTRFVVEDGVQHQLVRKRVEAALEYVDLSDCDEAQQQARFRALCEREETLGFTGAEPAMYRIALVRLSADRHRLLFTSHHSILDGWSIPLLLNQLLHNVKQLSRGEALKPAIEADYDAYMAWLLRQDADRAAEVWRDYLASDVAPATLKLPRLEQGEHPTHALLQEVIDAEQTRAIRDFARSYGVTLNTLVQFAWALVLRAYSGSSDVTFGAVVSGRPQEVENVDRMVGLFINTLPVRVKIESGPSGPQLNALQKAFHHNNGYAFLAYSEIKRNAGFSGEAALFETLIDFKNYPINEHESDGGGAELAVEAPEGYGTNSFDISLTVGVYERIMFNCNYRSDLYDAGYVAQMLSYLSEALVGLAQGRAVETIVPALPDLFEPPAPAFAPPAHAEADADLPLHCNFERIAAASPGRAALSCGDRTLSFGELDALANRIARSLIEQGVGAGEPVGLMFERGVESIAGLLGIFKAGAAYLPIDPAYPDERKRYMIEDSGLRHLLCAGDGGVAVLSGVRQHPIDRAEALAGFSAEPLSAAPPAPASLAYVIYTSGSTGKPKGVMVEHRNLRYLADGMRALGFDGSGCWAAVASFSFDASLQGVCHLLQGGHLVVLTDEEKIDADRLRQRLLQHRVDVVDCTPTLLDSWLEQGAEDVLPSLVIGGEGIPEALWRRLAERRRPGIRHFNAYGPTECTVNASMAEIEGERPHIGRCLAGAYGLVLDAQGSPCPVGVAGELYLGGRGVSRGYLGKDELTAQRFLADTVSGRAGRLYRTGDAVRLSPDGDFEYLGRLDDQVKINGHRIELDEIARVLESHPAVESALVLTSDADTGRTQLVACVRSPERADSASLPAELSDWLRQRLPAYMQPNRYVATDAWPMTGNGKIDRRRLLATASAQAAAGRAEASASAAEILLRALFAEVLGRDSVGLDENFYELGGDSILAIRLIAKAAKAGIKISIKQFAAHPSVRALAQACAGEAAAAPQTRLRETLHGLFAEVLGRDSVGADENFYELGGDSILAIRLIAKAAKAGIKISIKQFAAHPTIAALARVCGQAAGEGEGAAVEGVQRLLPIHHKVVVEQLHVGAEVFDHFNGGSLFAVPRGLDRARLDEIYRALRRKHDALRLAFDLAGPQPAAHYLPADAAVFADAVSVCEIDAGEGDIAAAVSALCRPLQSGFRLAEGGLFKLVLIRAADTDRLLMLAHHAIGDVVSWHVLVADLAEAVGQALRGDTVRLHGKSSSYQAWGDYLDACAKNGTFRAELDYWQAQRDPARLAPVALDAEVTAELGHWRQAPLALDAQATADLLESAAAYPGADINALLLAALYRGLKRWNGGRGYCVLLQSHGRHADATALDLSQTVGWFTQNHPLLLDFDAAGIDRDIAAVGATLAGVPNRGLGYGVLRFLAREPALQPAGAEPFQVLFNYLGRFDSMVRDAAPLTFLAEDIGPISHPRLPSSVPMGFQGGVYSGRLSMNLEFDARQFSDERMRRLAACVRDELLAIVDFSREFQAEASASDIT
ncbi:non-ribosomal peptide synthetase [Lysobacter enzymogenes]|uniref:Non-ribosomal peptide synthetase n=2 Tax=Bacteria TaxID=2 RepID=A0AAU9B6Y6_LYSEN|nr:non-ribosomal peptide synthetase [Lysobacter enzymogenes]BAV99521.1 non-ribosomal peptide synthetase [Lysobacter enzymogenes]